MIKYGRFLPDVNVNEVITTFLEISFGGSESLQLLLSNRFLFNESFIYSTFVEKYALLKKLIFDL